MSWPNPAEVFVRLPDVSPVSGNIQGLLDAIYTALLQTVDYRGTSVPLTHRWTIARYQNTGVTEFVYATPPSGTLLALHPALCWAGAAAGSPTMLGPDTFTAGHVLMCIVTDMPGGAARGAFGTWTAANPFTTGRASGFWKMGGTTWNSTGAIVRCFVSAESIFIQLTNSTGSNQSWSQMGAILEPFTSYALGGGAFACESDDRLYGMMSGGSMVVLNTGWQTVNGDANPWTHSSDANEAHMMVWQPGTSSVITVGRPNPYAQTSASLSSSQDMAGTYVASEMLLAQGSGTSFGGARIGKTRGIGHTGLLQSGRTIRSGSTDLFHVVSCSLIGTDDAILIAASP